jgi:hypothetical protein
MQCVTVIIQLVSRDHVCRFENGSQTLKRILQDKQFHLNIKAEQKEGNHTECVGEKRYRAPIMQCVTVIIQLVSRDHVCRFENGSQMAE